MKQFHPHYFVYLIVIEYHTRRNFLGLDYWRVVKA